jgi:aspartyl-tRNA(Asn)/glutamyl-tRNA(Gln) amidotransferase subunit B
MHEFERQVNTIIAGGEIYQETRSFDPITEDTHVMRSKEDATDYRYFPDPDLLPLIIDKRTITELKKNLPELPNIKKRRYMNDLNLTAYDADILVSDKKFAYFFESVVHNDINPKIAASWIITELFGKLNKAKLSIDESPISTVNFAKLMKLLSEDKISSKIAKQVFEIMFNTGEDPDTIIKRDNLITIDDDKALLEVINHIIINNMHEVEEYKNGKKKMLGFFVGEVMKMTEGKANPQKVNKILQDKLQ